jgi:hypothetical protein
VLPTQASPTPYATPTRTGTRLLIALVILGFAVRLAFGLGYWVGKPLMLDEREYLQLAARVATGQGFTYPPAPPGEIVRHFERPPDFAFFLAGILKLTGDPLAAGPDAVEHAFPQTSSDIPLAIRIAQSLVGAFGIVIIAALARRAAGNRAAVAAAAMAAVYPPLAWVCGYVLAEPLYSTLALATVWLLLRASDAASPGRGTRIALAAGLVAGIALLTKEAMLFFLPLALLWLLWRRQVRVAAALLVGVALVAVPWIARNHAVHGRFVLTAAHGGVTLWTGNNPLARGEGDLAANPDMGRARVAIEDAHPGLTNQDLDAIYYREVFRFVTDNPGGWLALEARKLYYTFVPVGPSYRLHSTRYYVTSLVSYGLILPLALIGAWRLRQRGALRQWWAVWLMAASVVVVSLVFFPQERFRIPVMDPILIACAACAWPSRRDA